MHLKFSGLIFCDSRVLAPVAKEIWLSVTAGIQKGFCLFFKILTWPKKVNTENKFSPFLLQNAWKTDPLVTSLMKKYKDSWSDFPNWYRDFLPISGSGTIRVLFSFFVLGWDPSDSGGHWLYTILTTHLQHVYLHGKILSLRE